MKKFLLFVMALMVGLFTTEAVSASTLAETLAGKTIRRAVSDANYVYVLAVDSVKNPTLVKADFTGNIVTTYKTDFCSKVGTVGLEMVLSDIALTEDGVLVGCNLENCKFSDSPTTNAFNVYKWNADGTGSVAFTYAEPFYASACWSNGLTGVTMAYKGTLAKGQMLVAGRHGNALSSFRHKQVLMVIDSCKVTKATVNEGRSYTEYPLPDLRNINYPADLQFITMGSSKVPELFEYSNTGGNSNPETLKGALSADYKGVTGASVFADGENTMMFIPSAKGVQALDITDGLNTATVAIELTAKDSIKADFLYAAIVGDKVLLMRDGKLDLLEQPGEPTISTTHVLDGVQLPTDYVESTNYVIDGIMYTFEKTKSISNKNAVNHFGNNECVFLPKGKALYNASSFGEGISKVEVYANLGASVKTVLAIAYSEEPITSATKFDVELPLKTTDSVYDAGEVPANAKYIYVKATDAANAQIQMRVTYEAALTPVHAVTFVSKADTIEVGDEYKLSYYINPVNATDQRVSFQSLTNGVVTVSDSGYVKAVAEGDAVVVIQALDSLTPAEQTLTDTCYIHVYDGSPKPEPEEQDSTMEADYYLSHPYYFKNTALRDTFVHDEWVKYNADGLIKITQDDYSDFHWDGTSRVIFDNINLSEAGNYNITLNYRGSATDVEFIVNGTSEIIAVTDGNSPLKRQATLNQGMNTIKIGKGCWIGVYSIEISKKEGDCNEYGWTSGEDMYWGFVADYNTYAGETVVTEYGPTKFYDSTYGKADVKTFFGTAPYASKWSWLYGYLCKKVGANYGGDAQTGGSAMTNASVARGAVDNFFNDGNLNSGAWNKSADFDQCCGISDYTAWQPTWGDTYCTKEDCNEYGWTSGEDMYKALAEDVWYYAHNVENSTFGFTNFDQVNISFNPSSNTAGTGVAFDVEPWDMNFFTSEPYASKWGWLVQYLDTTNIAGGFAKASSAQSSMRYSLTAFFGNDQRASWPQSADYTNCGIDTYAAWQPTWGKKFCSDPSGTVPTDAVLADYYETGQLCVCIYFEEEVCNDVVFTGTYNSWSSEPMQCTKFVPVDGFPGWYVVAVTDESPDIQGKPVQLKSDGTFSWDYQTGDVDSWTIVRGTVNITAGYVGESDLRDYSTASPVVLVSKYFKNHNTPCQDKPEHTYTVILKSPVCEGAVPAIIGDFNSWAIGIAMEASEEVPNQYSYSFQSEEGHGFKIKSGANADWDNEIVKYDANLAQWCTLPNTILTADSVVILDYSGDDYQYQSCLKAKESQEPDYYLSNPYYFINTTLRDTVVHDEAVKYNKVGLIKLQSDGWSDFHWDGPSACVFDNINMSEAGEYYLTINLRGTASDAYYVVNGVKTDFVAADQAYMTTIELNAGMNEIQVGRGCWFAVYSIELAKKEKKGGCNEYGWTSGEDMYWGFVEDYNTYAGETVVTEYGPSKFYEPTYGKADVKAFFADANYKAKWGWLYGYLCVKVGENRGQDSTSASEILTTSSVMRCAVDNFFNNGNLNSGMWNRSFDFDQCCGISDYNAWQPRWGSYYCIKENCNEYGWKNKGEMFLAFQSDLNDSLVAQSKDPLNVVKLENDSIFYYVTLPSTSATQWVYWETAEQAGITPNTDDESFSSVTFACGNQVQSFMKNSEKWAWLTTYLKTVSSLTSFSNVQLRCNIQGFFLSSPSMWASADYTTTGKYTSFQPAWGDKFCTGVATVSVNYNLGGGVTNDYGWTKPEDMYQGLASDVLESYSNGIGVCTGWTFASEFLGRGTFGTPDVNGNEGVALDIQTFDLTFWTTEPYASKWGWLKNYLDETATTAGVQTPSFSAGIRYALAAFFSNSIRDSWPRSADYTYSGVSNITMWQSYWKHAWDNPTEFPTDSTVVLNTPYKDGESFLGWFLNEAGTGESLTEISSLHNGQTIYAIFGKYVSNMEEVWNTYYAFDPETTSVTIKAGGVVTYLNGASFYIQDDFGGMQCYQKGADTIITLGDKITVEGTLVDYNGVPEIKNITKYEVLAQGQEVNVPTVTLADVDLTYDGKCYTKMYFEALKLYDAKDKNLYFCDGKDSVIYYDKTLLANDYIVGKKYSITGVLTAYYGKRELVNNEILITPIPSVAADPSYYEVKKVQNELSAAEDLIDYTITSNWLISRNMGNWDQYKPNPVAEQSRGMCVANGKVYVNWRSSNSPDAGTMKLNVYDAASGDKLDDVFFKDYVFQQPGADTTGTRVVVDSETGFTYLAEDYEWNYNEFTEGVIFAPNTDMQVDDAGHILVSSMTTEGHVMQIWKIDPETGDGEIVLYLGGNSGISDLSERFPMSGTIRLDRFAVDGDVTKDATIIYSCEGSSNVYEFDIYDGEWDGEVVEIMCLNGATPSEDPVAFSYCSRPAFIEGGEAFYIDGVSTYPELFDWDGNMLESFKGVFDEMGEEVNPSCLEKLYNDSLVASPVGVCGCQEFKVGGATFFAMAGGSYESSYEPYSSTKIFRYKDANCHFYEMTPMWEVSKDGFGNTKNAQFNYVQQAVVVDELTTELYVYVAENGLAKYTITASKNIEKSKPTSYYLVGSCTDNWNLSAAIEFKQVDSVFTATVPDFTGSFKIVANRSWDVQYGSNGDGVEFNKDYVMQQNSGNISFVNPFAGYYNATFTLDTATMTLKLISGTPYVVDRNWYIPGTQTGWVCDESSQFTKVNDSTYQFFASEFSGDFKVSYGVWDVEFGANDESSVWTPNKPFTMKHPCYYNLRAASSNVYTDVTITLNVNYTKAEVTITLSCIAPKDIVIVEEVAGTLGQKLLEQISQWSEVGTLTVIGTMNAKDMKYLKRLSNVTKIDLSQTDITFIEGCSGLAKLQEIILPASVTEVNDNAFQNCSVLSNINLTNVTTVGKYAFYGCTSLSSISLPVATSIGDYAFAYCNSITDISLPVVTSIGSSAFYFCHSIITLSVPSVTSIGNNAFGYCNNLITVTLPATLISLGYRAFYNCSVQDVYCYVVSPITTYTTNNTTISSAWGDVSAATLHVPSVSVTAYKLHDSWYMFGKIVPLDEPISVLRISSEFYITNYAGLTNMVDLSVIAQQNSSYNYQNGHLTIAADSALHVNNYFQNHWRYESESNNVDGYSTLIPNNLVTAENVSLEYAVLTDRWNFISLPFDVAVSDIVCPEGTLWVIRKYSGSDRASMSGNTWQNMTTETTLKAGEGYILQCSNSKESFVPFTFKAVNNANKNNIFAYQNVTKSLSAYPASLAHNRGWNLVGNPYPCFFNTESIEHSGVITIWNGNGYTAYSLLDDNYQLRPGEAFFVQCPDNGSAMTFKAEGRSHEIRYDTDADYDYAPARHIATTGSLSDRLIYNLTLSDGNYTDRARLVLNEQAQMDYELTCDASKFMSTNTSVPQLYILENGQKLSIDERPLGTGFITLGAYFGTTGEYTISLKANPDPETTVVLKDNENGTTVTLSDGESYTFNAFQGTFEARFTIIITSPQAPTGVDNLSDTSSDTNSAMYNISGQLVTEPTNGVNIIDGKKIMVK